MTWIRMDPDELTAAGAVVAAVAIDLDAANARLYAARNTPGLGPTAARVEAEFQAVGEALLAVRDGLTEQAQDVLQRAALASREQNAAGTVGTVGAVAGALGGGALGITVVGGGGTTPGAVGGMAGVSGSGTTSGGYEHPFFGPGVLNQQTSPPVTGDQVTYAPEPARRAPGGNDLGSALAISSINNAALHNIGVNVGRMNDFQVHVDPGPLKGLR